MKQLFVCIPALALALVAACSRAEVEPAQPDSSAMCATCRMTVSDLRFAAQLIAPGEEPLFFDDIGCMRRYEKNHGNEVKWTSFVTDYTSKSWLRADRAKYWKCESIQTPMGSGIVATSAEVKPAGDCNAL